MSFQVPALEFVGQDPGRLPSLGRVLRDPLHCWPPAVLHRPYVEGKSGSRRITLIAEPEAVNEVLLDRTGRFPRCGLHERILESTYGETLVRGRWPEQRRAIAKPVSSERTQRLLPRMELALARALGEWRKRCRSEPLDLLLEARRLTLDLLWRSFFCSVEQAESADPLVDSTAEAVERRGNLPDQMGELDSLAQEAVRRNGLASTAVEGRAELDVNTIRLFLHTGHDNSAPTLAWALWLLAIQPEWQQRVRDEWKDAGTRARIDPAGYPRTRAVLRETLRLFPPIMQLSREIESEIEVAGETLGPGFTAVLNLYAMHRSRLWWDAPDNFDPGRFLGGVEESRHRLLWLPFGAGPRGCIGAMFAQVALILSLGRIVAAFELLPNPDEGLAATADWALRPQGRRPVFVRPLA